MDSKPYVDFSVIESDLLGMKVGRCNDEYIDAQLLQRELLDGGFDFCRVKTLAEDEFATLNIESSGLPVYFSGSIRRYKTPVVDDGTIHLINKTLIFEPYDGSQLILLRQMLDDTWGNYPLGYYKSPIIGAKVTKKLEMDCLYKYYSIHNLTRDYPLNSILFMKDGDNYVGFFALNIIGDHLESHIGGILQPFQKGGYFLDMLNYIRRFCLEHQLGHFLFGARNENAQVQKIFQKFGFKAYGNDNVYHIPCFYGLTTQPEVQVAFNESSITDLEQACFLLLKQKSTSDSSGKYRSQFQFQLFIEKGQSPVSGTLTVPIDRPEEAMYSLKIKDGRGQLLGIATLRVIK